MDNQVVKSRRGRPPAKKEVPKEKKVEPSDGKMPEPKKEKKVKPIPKADAAKDTMKDLKLKLKDVERKQRETEKSLKKIEAVMKKM